MQLSPGTQKRKYPSILWRHPKIREFLVAQKQNIYVNKRDRTVIYPVLVKCPVNTTGNVSVPYTMLMRYAFINKPISATMDFVSFRSSGKTNTTSFVSLPYTSYMYLDMGPSFEPTTEQKSSYQDTLASYGYERCLSSAFTELNFKSLDYIMIFGYIIYIYTPLCGRTPQFTS